MQRLSLFAAALVGLAVGGLSLAAQPDGDGGWVKLFNGKDLTGWKVFLDPKKNAAPKEIFTVKDGVIHCQGSVNGYIRTEKEHGDYVLKLKWRWGD